MGRFRLALRLQHLTQVVGSFSSDSPERAAAKAAIIEGVEWLRWQLWNGRIHDAGISLVRIQVVKPAFQGEPDNRRSFAPSRKLWIAGRRIVAGLSPTPASTVIAEVQP